MLNVSNEFKELMKSNTDFREYAEVTFADGTKMLLDDRDFTTTNNYITDGAGISSLPVGVAIQKRIQIEILNDHEQFEELDFFGAKIRLYLTFQLSETVEKLEKGIYTVVTPETHGETVVINAYDDMYRADKAYTTKLSFPTTLKMVLVDICDTCDIPLLSTTFKNDDMVLQEAPAGEYTFRQVIGYIAMIAGGNARINVNGYLEIKSYEFMENVYDGGDFTFSNSDTVLDGGDFTFSNSDETVDGGAFSPWVQDTTISVGDIPEDRILDSWNPGSLTIDTNDITITGVKITYTVENEQKTDLVGDEGYVISVQNPLLDGDVSSGISVIADSLIGLKFRKFEGDHIANPLLEFMDMVFVKDRRGRIYKSILTDVNFNVCGFTTVKNSAASFLKNETVYANSGAVTEVQTRKLIEREKTARELAVEQLGKELENSSGMYQTDEMQPDGSVIRYMHDKRTLAESMNVIKFTAEAIGVSNDGGKTYPYGFSLTGDMVVRILSSEGVNADWINAGHLSANRIQGGELAISGAGSDIVIKGQQINFQYNGIQVGYIASQGENEGVRQKGIYAQCPYGAINFYVNTSPQGVTQLGTVALAVESYQAYLDRTGATSGEYWFPVVIKQGMLADKIASKIIDARASTRGLSNASQNLGHVYTNKLTATESTSLNTLTVSGYAEMESSRINGTLTFDQYDGAIKLPSDTYFENPGSTSLAANLCVVESMADRIYKSSSSSKRYKDIGRAMKQPDIDPLYNIKPVFAKYKDGYLSEDDERCGVYHPMFIAEEVEKYAPFAVDHLPDGRAENWNYRIMIPYMFQMIKSQKETIDDLTGRLERLETMMKGDA